MTTNNPAYAKRLRDLEQVWWKRWLNVQAPYRWNLRRLHLGFTLDVGCGRGRHLLHLGGNGVGVDHNVDLVAVCRLRGLEAYSPDEFARSPRNEPVLFDSILVSHVVEHMSEREAVALLKKYVHTLKPEGRLVLITPQEKGYASDPTHMRFVDFGELVDLCSALGFTPVRRYSFPFPRFCGRWFTHNELVLIAARG
jgi:SAM-dependent methyltransferase